MLLAFQFPPLFCLRVYCTISCTECQLGIFAQLTAANDDNILGGDIVANKALKVLPPGAIEKVYAVDTSINDASRTILWRCINPACSVRMTLYNAGRPSATFRSHRGEADNHIGGGCIISDITYSPHTYDDSLFIQSDFFDHVLRDKTIPATSTGKVSKGRPGHIDVKVKDRTAIRTIYELYGARLHHGITGTINGFSISELIADEDNFSKYKHGFVGDKLVRCVAYRYISATQHIIFIYPRFLRGKRASFPVAIHIPDENLFKTMRKRLFPSGASWKTKKHSLICGHWQNRDVDGEIMPCCEFIHPRKQFHLLKYD